MKQRQKEGRRMAKVRGVKFGRPSIPIPEGFIEIAERYKRKEITSDEAVRMSGLTRGTFYRKLAKLI